MKVVRLPTEHQGDIWVIVHDLRLSNQHQNRVRPIHLLTLVGHLRCSVDPQKGAHLFHALENKLVGANTAQLSLRSALAQVGDWVYSQPFLVDYKDQQLAICTLDSYLNAIYSALEITAYINKLIYKELPRGFRRQSKKFELFSFQRNEWLGHFFDIRTELTHYTTPLPLLDQQTIHVEFYNDQQLEHFKKGKHEVPFLEILNYLPALFGMLDHWATQEIGKIDREKEIPILTEGDFNASPTNSIMKISELLRSIPQYPEL